MRILTKFRFGPVLLLAVLLVLLSGPALAEGQCSNEPIQSPMHPAYPYEPITGSATLCATQSGLKAQMRASNLVPGHAYTVWWIYIDEFPACSSMPECDFLLFFADDPAAVMGRMGSAIAGANGKAHFGGSVNGMVASPGAEVWLFMMDHEEASLEDGRALARQLLTPEDAIFGAPHLGIEGGEAAWPAASTFHIIE